MASFQANEIEASSAVAAPVSPAVSPAARVAAAVAVAGKSSSSTLRTFTTPTEQSGILPASFGSSHGDHHSKTTDNDDGNDTDDQREAKVVSFFRLLVLFVLVASMACTATAVQMTMTRVEEDAFAASFVSDSNDVIESVGETLYTSLGAVDSYLVSLVSTARSTNQSWPYVTMPDASVRLAKLRSLSKAFSVMQAHFVTNNQKAAWENYTTTHHDWAYDAIRIQATDPNYHGKQYSTLIHKPYIRSHLGNSTGPGPFLPTWHSSPYIPDTAPYNVDAMAYSHFVNDLPELVDHQCVVICKSNSIANASDPASVTEAKAAVKFWSAIVNPATDDPSEPISWIVAPIVDDVADHVLYNASFSNHTVNSNRRKVVGVVFLFVFWRDLIRNILPNDTNGIIVVFSNACGQAFSYKVNGRSTTYLGPTDRHDVAFNGMGKSIGFDQLVHKSTTGRQYTGLPLGDGSCPYTLSVYPSAERQAHFTSSRPAIFTTCAVFIFVFTSVVFIVYDSCVERRQRKISLAALESRASVSLLEHLVSERTQSLEEANRRLEDSNRRLEEANQRLEEANRCVTKAYQAQLEHFACMSHEIRTPLNCIIGMSSLLLDTKLDAMQEESIRMIISSGDLLLTVVNDVLDFAKLESGNVDIVPTRSNLQYTLNTVVQSMEAKAKPKKLKIRTVLDPLVGEFMHIDGRRLQQILYNLLGNAVKFSHEGGSIQLSVSLLPGTTKESKPDQGPSCSGEIFRSDTIVVLENTVSGGGDLSLKKGNSFTISSLHGSGTSTSFAKCDRRIRFTVRDCGSGIERKDFETIFQPFRQASAEMDRVFGGTGLGLAITSRLVASMGGTISVDSEFGEWSEFSVDLPYSDSPVDIESLASRLQATRVVLVDGDLDMVQDMSIVFRRISLELACYRTMTDMMASFHSACVTRQSCICLVHEQLYDCKWGKSLTDAGCVLLTHGPNFTVKESKGHYRSLTNVFPGVLLESFLAVLDSVARSPRDRSTLPGSTAKTLMVESPSEMLRILIAEDNIVNQKVLLKILDRLQYKNVDVVDDGRQACDREAIIPYDVIFMDIQMPNIDGIEACKEILGRASNHPKPRIIFITAHVSDSYEATCRAAGGVDFLAKPVHVSDVDECLRRNISPNAARLSPPANGVDSMDECSQRNTEPQMRQKSPEVASSALNVSTTPPKNPSTDNTTGVHATSMKGCLVKETARESIRILIAEDNKINQKVLVRILQRLNYTNVDIVDDGQQACDQEQRSLYDVILMDVQMPVMDGIAACREILGRDSIHSQKPKVIFVSAHALESVETECRAAGGVDFIAKPVNLTGMDQCLQRHVFTPSE